MKQFLLLLISLFTALGAGAQWVSNGPYGGFIQCFTSNSSGVFVGTYYGGVYLSTDGGNSWTARSNGLASLDINSMATGDTGIFAATANGICFSTNNGLNWQTINSAPLPTGMPFNSVGASGGLVFANIPGYSTWVSVNKGATWVEAAGGLQSGETINCFVPVGDRVYACTFDGVYLFNRSSLSWTSMNTGILSQYVNGIASDGFHLYASTQAGVCVSDTTGTAWQSFTSGLNGVTPNCILLNNGKLYIGAQDAGIYSSSVSSNNWQPVSGGALASTTWVAALITSGSNIIAGAWFTGIFVSTNGTTWSANDNGLSNIAVSGLVADGSAVLCAAGSYHMFESDNGSVWAAAINNLADGSPRALASTGTVIYTGGGTNGVYSTTDNGGNWTSAGLSGDNIVALAINATTLYAATSSAIYYSGNGGATWTPNSTGLSGTVQNMAAANGLAFTGTSKGLYVSSSIGGNWQSTGIGAAEVTGLAATDSIVYVATAGYPRVYYSTNSGSTWTADTGLPVAGVNAFLITGTGIWAGTDSGAFFKPVNSQQWRPEGLSLYDITAFTATDSFIFAGTQGNGVWQRLPIDCRNVAVTLNAVKTGICTGDSTALCATTGFSYYQWNGGATSGCLQARQAGNYFVMATDTNGCTAVSDTVALTLYPAPVDTIATTGKLIFCPGDSVQVCSTPGFTSYQWPTGMGTGNCVQVTAAGNYYVIVTDSNGCTAQSNSLSFTVYSAPPVSLTEKGDTLSSPGENGHYQWYLNNQALTGDTMATLIAQQPGAYIVAVTDSNGCVATSQAVQITGISEVEAGSFSIYPNPATGSFVLQTASTGVQQLRVFSLTGQLLLTRNITTQKTIIDTGTLPVGVYILSIQDNAGVATKKLVVGK